MVDIDPAADADEPATAASCCRAGRRAGGLAGAGARAQRRRPQGAAPGLPGAGVEPSTRRRPTATCYSSTLIAQILEAPLTYDYLARPVPLVPQTARRCPRSRPTAGSSRCASSPASTSPTTRPSRAGRASWWPQDYVYTIKRFYDPQYNSSDLYLYETAKLPGLTELRAGRR